MKRSVFPLLLIFLLFPADLRPQELFSIGIRPDRPDPGIVWRQYREGTWKEEAFAPAAGLAGNFCPALAVSPAGEVWAVWAGRQDGEKPKIYFSRKQGEIWSEPARVSRNRNFWEMTPAIAFDGAGRTLVAWSGEDNDDSAIYLARWDGAGFGPAERLNAPDPFPDLHPALAASPKGRILLVWQGWDGEYFQVYCRLFEGESWTPKTTVGGGGRGDRSLPFATALAGDRWECFWSQAGRIFSSSGRPGAWSNPTPAGETLEKRRAPAGESPLTGWVVEVAGPGDIRTGRSGAFFGPGAAPPAEKAAGQAEKLKAAARVYIGFGDSITYGTNGPPEGKCYIPLLQADLEAAHFTAYTIPNHGYPGMDTFQLLFGAGNLPKLKPCPGIDAVLSLYPASRILIMAGTNDYPSGFAPAFSRSNLAAMIDRSRAAGCEPVLATIIPCCQTLGFYEWTEELSRNYIVPLATEKGCLLANPFEIFVGYGSWDVWKNFLVEDCEHPIWTAGSRLIADAWFAALSAPLSTLPLLDSGDYNGDGSAEIAIFRPATGLWAVREVTRTYFGREGDIPAAGDYDGDGTSDLALFRPTSGLWAVRSVTRAYFGTTGDIPAPGDYNGSGSCRPAIYRGSSRLWSVRGVTRAYFGTAGDIPVPAYYSGGRIKNIAVFRPTSGLWAVRGRTRFYFGRGGDQPAPADYSGNGTETAALFRPLSGLWAIRGESRFYYGSTADQPLPAPYDGDAARAAVFRESSGLWVLRDLSRLYFGTGGDIPVSGRRTRPITPTPTRTPPPSPPPTPLPSPAPTRTPPPSPPPTPLPSPSPSITPTSL